MVAPGPNEMHQITSKNVRFSSSTARNSTFCEVSHATGQSSLDWVCKYDQNSSLSETRFKMNHWAISDQLGNKHADNARDASPLTLNLCLLTSDVRRSPALLNYPELPRGPYSLSANNPTWRRDDHWGKVGQACRRYEHIVSASLNPVRGGYDNCCDLCCCQRAARAVLVDA